MRRAMLASRSITSNPSSISRLCKFLRMVLAAALEDSTKVALRAPRLIASIPTAPLPANRSSQTESGTLGATTLKSVSRRRSEVGRVDVPGGASNLRLRNFPAITRIGPVLSLTTHNLTYRITIQGLPGPQNEKLVSFYRAVRRRGLPGPRDFLVP